MEIKNLPSRLTETTIKDLNGKLITVPVYALSPQEAQELNHSGYRLILSNEKENSERLYMFSGTTPKTNHPSEIILKKA